MSRFDPKESNYPRAESRCKLCGHENESLKSHCSKCGNSLDPDVLRNESSRTCGGCVMVMAGGMLAIIGCCMASFSRSDDFSPSKFGMFATAVLGLILVISGGRQWASPG